MESRIIKQEDLTSECWSIQFEGLKACQCCEYKNSSNCGGKDIRKKLMNKKGIKITATEGIK